LALETRCEIRRAMLRRGLCRCRPEAKGCLTTHPIWVPFALSDWTGSSVGASARCGEWTLIRAARLSVSLLISRTLNPGDPRTTNSLRIPGADAPARQRRERGFEERLPRSTETPCVDRPHDCNRRSRLCRRSAAHTAIERSDAGRFRRSPRGLLSRDLLSAGALQRGAPEISVRFNSRLDTGA
jgi:hypothetical protein